MRQFSINSAGHAIHLYNIAAKKIVENASLKAQCAKDYIYGEDLRLEKALQAVEGEYAQVIRAIQKDPYSLSTRDLSSLRFFVALQYSRTDAAMRRMNEMHLAMNEEVFRGDLVAQSKHSFVPDDREIMRTTMRFGVLSKEAFADLKPCIMLNQTGVDFITSDDPAIFTSRFYLQKLRMENFGVLASGGLLVLPLTPRASVMFYDGSVYVMPGKRANCIEVTKERDILAFNELQCLKAMRNLYFFDQAKADQVKGQFADVEQRRPASWFNTSVLVPDGSGPPGVENYRAASADERQTARTFVVALQGTFPAPSQWFSQLAFRSKPRTYYNGTAVGHVRKAEWLRGSPFRGL